MLTMSPAAGCDSKEPYASDSDEPEEPQGPPGDVDRDDDEEEDDIGGLTEAEREEMERLNSQLDFLNVALDEFEQKNSDLQQRLLDFLAQARGSSDKTTAAKSDDTDDKGATESPKS